MFTVSWKTGSVTHSVQFKSVEDAEAAASLLVCLHCANVTVRKADKQVRFSVNKTGEIVMAIAT